MIRCYTVKYHRLAADWETRNQVGTAPVLPIIKRYQQFKSFADFAQNIAALEKKDCLMLCH